MLYKMPASTNFNSWHIAFTLFIFILLFSSASLANQETYSLFEAIEKNEISTVKKLLDKTTNLKVMKSSLDCATPLETAAKLGNIDMVKLIYNELSKKKLLTERPDKDCNIIGKNALISAAENGHKEIVLFLSKKGIISLTALSLAISINDLGIVKALLIHHPLFYRLDVPASKGSKSPISLAITLGHHKIVEYFISKGAKITSTDAYIPPKSHNQELLYLITKHATNIPGYAVFNHAATWNSRPDLLALVNNKIVFSNLKEKEKAVKLVIENDYHKLVSLVINDNDYNIKTKISCWQSDCKVVNKNILERALVKGSFKVARHILQSPRKMKIHWKDHSLQKVIARVEPDLLDILKTNNQLPGIEEISYVSIVAIRNKNWPLISWLIDNYPTNNAVDLIALVSSPDFMSLDKKENILTSALEKGYDLNVNPVKSSIYKNKYYSSSVLTAAVKLGYETSFITFLLKNGLDANKQKHSFPPVGIIFERSSIPLAEAIFQKYKTQL